jgi:hypothetical protein
MAQTHLLLPLLAPLWFPFQSPFTYLESLLSCGAIPSTLVHLGPRLLVNWPPLPQTLLGPSPVLSHSKFIPNTPGKLCTILRRHHDSGFTRSGTIITIWEKYSCKLLVTSNIYQLPKTAAVKWNTVQDEWILSKTKIVNTETLAVPYLEIL